jgi:hypothetical protein
MSNINRLAIKNIIVPNVFYNIDTTGYNIQNRGNNTLQIKNVTQNLTIQIFIPAGNYTVQTLIDAINVQLAFPGTIGLTLSQDPVTKKLSFLSGGDSFAYSLETMGTVLGMVNPPSFDGPGLVFYNLEGFPNLTGVKEIYIGSTRMSDGSHLVVPFGSTLPIIAAVPISVGFGEFQTYIAPNIELDELVFPSYSAGSNLRTIDIQVRDSFGNILDTGGLPTTITFKAWHMQN